MIFVSCMEKVGILVRFESGCGHPVGSSPTLEWQQKSRQTPCGSIPQAVQETKITVEYFVHGWTCGKSAVGRWVRGPSDVASSLKNLTILVPTE